MQVNGAVKQDGNTKDMIFSIPKLIEHVSSIMTLEVCLNLSVFAIAADVSITGRRPDSYGNAFGSWSSRPRR